MTVEELIDELQKNIAINPDLAKYNVCSTSGYYGDPYLIESFSIYNDTKTIDIY